MVDRTFSERFFAAALKAAIRERASFNEELSRLLTAAIFCPNFPVAPPDPVRPYTEIVGFYRFHFR